MSRNLHRKRKLSWLLERVHRRKSPHCRCHYRRTRQRQQLLRVQPWLLLRGLSPHPQRTRRRTRRRILAFLVGTVFEALAALAGAGSSSSDESDSDDDGEATFLAATFLGEGTATLGASDSLSLESDVVEGALATALTWAALGFSSSDSDSELSSDDEDSLAFLDCGSFLKISK